MTYRRDKNRNPRKKGKFQGLLIQDEKEISAEKQKARKLRETAWWRKKCASGLCTYCGRKVSVSELTMDHVIPLSRGGRSERFNIVPACKDCNNKKKYLLPSEWEDYLFNINKGSSQTS